MQEWKCVYSNLEYRHVFPERFFATYFQYSELLGYNIPTEFPLLGYSVELDVKDGLQRYVRI